MLRVVLAIGAVGAMLLVACGSERPGDPELYTAIEESNCSELSAVVDAWLLLGANNLETSGDDLKVWTSYAEVAADRMNDEDCPAAGRFENLEAFGERMCGELEKGAGDVRNSTIMAIAEDAADVRISGGQLGWTVNIYCPDRKPVLEAISRDFG